MITTMHHGQDEVETGTRNSADEQWAAAVDAVLADQAAATVSELIETTLLETLADYGRLVLDTEPDEAGLDALADMLDEGLVRPQDLVVPAPAVQLLTGAPAGEDRPPLPTRPPNPGRHDRAPSDTGPVLPHPHAVPVGEDERPPLPRRVPGATNPPPSPAPTARIAPETAPSCDSLCHCNNVIQDLSVCGSCGCAPGTRACGR